LGISFVRRDGEQSMPSSSPSSRNTDQNIALRLAEMARSVLSNEEYVLIYV